MAMDISKILATVLDGRTKGIPGTTPPFALSGTGRQGWNVLNEDMPLPLMVLKRSNLDYNANLFADYLSAHNLSLAPHGKTTMTPQIFDEQLRHGAWAITAATVNQVQVMRRYGVERILLANQLVGKAHLKSIASELNSDPCFEFYCFIDSLAQLRNMKHNLKKLSLNRPIRLLIEIGAAGGRTGVRTREAALSILHEIERANPRHFTFAGLSAFEGALPNLDKGSEPVEVFTEFVVEVAKAISTKTIARMNEFILTGGGSAYFDMIADRFKSVEMPVPVRVLLRSGCYVTNDHGVYQALQEAARRDPSRHWDREFRPALEVWSYVQSMPEPGLAFLTMGKRDIPVDAGFPKPVKRYRPGSGFLEIGNAEMFDTNDQHAYVRLGTGADWQVGDMICSGISHPCTAFDKWRFIPVVNDDYDVTEGMLTFF